MKRNIRRLAAAILTATALLSFSGCSTWMNLLTTFGVDTYHYAEEDLIGFYEEENEQTAPVMELARRLLLDSYQLPLFDNSSDAILAYQDAVLISLLSDNYSRYAGNSELLGQIEKKYPKMKCCVFVPQNEYEMRMYSMFGGGWKLTNRSSLRFTYLEDFQGYVLITTFSFPQAQAEFVSMTETEHTFRLTFRVSLEATEKKTYEALLFKREDGSLYFRSLVSK